MHKEQIVGIAVRLFAIFLGLYTLRYVGGILRYTVEPSLSNVSVTFLFLPALILALVAILLWFFPLTVATKIIPSIKTSSAPTSLDAGGIEVIAFSVMGLWVLTTAIPDAFHWITFVYLAKSVNVGNSELSPENIGYIVSTIVELVIGFWLLFGSRGLLGIIRRARYTGT